MTPAQNLATAIAACRHIDPDELLESFTRTVSEHHDEAEFAQAFAKVHKLTHAWMNTPPKGRGE